MELRLLRSPEFKNAMGGSSSDEKPNPGKKKAIKEDLERVQHETNVQRAKVHCAAMPEFATIQYLWWAGRVTPHGGRKGRRGCIEDNSAVCARKIAREEFI